MFRLLFAKLFGRKPAEERQPEMLPLPDARWDERRAVHPVNHSPDDGHIYTGVDLDYKLGLRRPPRSTDDAWMEELARAGRELPEHPPFLRGSGKL